MRRSRKHPVASVGCDLFWATTGLPVYQAAHTPSINCLNSTTDVTNKYSFGLNSSAVGEDRAGARYACTQKNIKSFVFLVPNLPQYDPSTAGSITNTVGPTLTACGKTVNTVEYPLTAVDPTPYVNQALGYKPDFIAFSGIGSQVVSFFQVFKTEGWPASKVSMPDTDITPPITNAAGSLINGTVILGQYGPWGQSTPEFQTFAARSTTTMRTRGIRT